MILRQSLKTMRKELTKYSSIGNRAGILLLCRKVLTGKTETLSSIGASCSFINGIDLNFKCGIIAFEEIKLITIKKDTCFGDKIIYSDRDENTFIIQLCRYCMETLIDMELIKIEHLKYNEMKDAFQIPLYAFKMECSVFRNLLITFDALIPDGTHFTINKTLESFFSRQVSRKRRISQEQLLRNIENERIIGEKGEEFVLEYEKKRCPFSPEQQRKIKQISSIDASAGFDIISLSDEINEEKRYIEVKTYTGKIHFYWSSNEIDSAKLRNDKYYLYLVDFSKIEDINYKPVIVQNPYVNVRKHSIWDIKPSSYLISTEYCEEEVKLIVEQPTVINSTLQTKTYLQEEEEPYTMAAETTYETYKWKDASLEVLHIFGDNGTILVGGYKNKKHFSWILENGIYNIRLGRRVGSALGLEKCINEAENLILYDIYAPNNFQVYNIHNHCEKKKADMIAMNYPSKRPGALYMTFEIKRNLILESYMDKDIIIKLLEELANHKNGVPIFIEP